MPSGFRLWSNPRLAREHFHFPAIPRRRSAKTGDRGHPVRIRLRRAAALKSIKDAGGLVFAQEFKTARQPDMPQSAVKTGCVDRLLSPAEIAAQLGRIGAGRERSGHWHEAAQFARAGHRQGRIARRLEFKPPVGRFEFPREFPVDEREADDHLRLRIDERREMHRHAGFAPAPGTRGQFQPALV